MSLTYGSYLRLPELLNLQSPQSPGPEHDEMLFIVIHQTYELWFKQLLHETDHLCLLLDSKDTGRVMHTLKRILTIIKVAVHQVDILETMTPLEFLTFRGRLASASGFQSLQFRELECCLGYKRPEFLNRFDGDPDARNRLARRLEAKTLWDHFLHNLAAAGHPVPSAELNRDVRQSISRSPTLQPVLIDVYESDPIAATICERLLDWDEGIQEWRYRHVKMVERTIGGKTGTGGSPGVQYLQKTLFKPLFPDLWEIRNEFGQHHE